MKAFRTPGPIAALMVLCAAMAGCGTEAATPKKQVSRPVKVLKVTGGEAAFNKSYPGVVKACREVDLSFRVNGLLTEFPVKAGQKVAKGQLIAKLDPRDFRIRVARTKAAFEESKKQYQRYNRLITSKAVSEATLDARRREFLTAKAAYDEALAALADTALRAPFAGVVAETMVENHQEVESKQPVVSLQDISNLEVEVQVPEKHMIKARTFEEVKLFVALDALPGKQFPAQLKEQTAQADPNTQTFSVTVVLANPQDFNVLPGMTAELRACAIYSPANRSTSVRVPVEAVLADESKRSSVWMINPETHTVHLVPVKLGQISEGSVSVTSGLSEGDTIVVAGVHHVRRGMKVRILNSSKE